MKLQRLGPAAALLASVVALAGCGSDDDSANPPAGGGQSNDCASGTFNAAGSSAQKTAFNAWIDGYQAKCTNAAVNYDGSGSGNGRTQFIQKQVPLAGSDSHLKDEQVTQANERCTGGKAVNIPMVLTPVAIIYRLPGVDRLTVTPTILAKIFSEKITTWNDPEIAKANPGVTLPATSITSVHRASDSGTTDNFTKFLDAQDPVNWTYGTGQAWKAPGGQGAKDSAAVVQTVNSTDGSIAYVDGPDAKKNNLKPAALDTGSGPVELTKESVGKAVDAADVAQDGADITVNINYGLKQPDTYPAILAVYEITCTAGLPADQATFVRTFLTYTSGSEGQGLLDPIGYTPLPDSLLSKVKSSVSSLPAA